MADDSKPAPPPSNWIQALADPLASIYTFTECMELADVYADGDNKLVIADLGTGKYQMKLKVYKGKEVVENHTLTDLPTAVAVFLMDLTEPLIPAVAVASGSVLFVYKNFRPFFKFTLPPLALDENEKALWDQANADKINVQSLKEMLSQLDKSSITARSLKLLGLPSSELEDFVNSHKGIPLKRQTVITCLTTLKKNSPEERVVSCLVIGTEARQILILDPKAFTILKSFVLPSVPVFLSVSGLFDVEFRMLISCRDGGVYSLKKSSENCTKAIAQLDSQAVGLLRIDKTFVVGCMDQTLNGFSIKGKKLYSLSLPASIYAMTLFDHKSRGLQGCLVSLGNGQVHIYREKVLVDTIHCPSAVTAMRFGRYGREDGTLILITKAGELVIQYLKRTAKFDERAGHVGPPESQDKKLNVPKKTKLYVDQTMRERQNGTTMHRIFQQDLFLLRLNTAKSYLSSLDKGLNPVSVDPDEPLKVAAQVQGIGPTFKLQVHVQSMAVQMNDLYIYFHYDDKLYSSDKDYISIPILVPGVDYIFETFVECLNDRGISDNIKVFVVKHGENKPKITAVISMPVSEPAMN